MTDQEIIECLNSLSEDEMIEKVLVPLYRKRFKGEFYDVEFTGKDKREDQGIDITYYERSKDTKAKEYSGVQVKQGKINTGKGDNGIAAISIQAQQAFSKSISDVSEKSNYFIKNYIILTTGSITSAARAQIVDQFADKNFRFIDDKKLLEWINESYWDEFKSTFELDEVEEDVTDDRSPLESIIFYLENNHKKEIEHIEESLNVLDPYQVKIVKTLMLESPLKEFSIAKAIGTSISNLRDDIQELVNQEVLDGDEDGLWINYDIFGYWPRIQMEAENRIEQLDYIDEVTIEDVIEELF